MRRYLLYFSYFGTRYRGLQKQNIKGNPFYEDPHTICGLLEIALKGCGPVNYPVVIPSSRTDKGVHALCNTAHVDLDGDVKKINSCLIAKQLNNFFEYNDHDIRVLKVQQVADDFHSRYNAYERQYLYRLAVPRPGIPFRESSLIPSPISEFCRCYFLQKSQFDVEAAKSACSLFVGLKDFAALSSKSKRIDGKKIETKREVLSLEFVPASPLLPCENLSQEYDFWNFTCSGRSFLYHMVRRIVSSILAYGQGRVTLADLQRLFREPVEESWGVIGSIVPPHGLYLVNVLYRAEDLVFDEKLMQEEIIAAALMAEESKIIDKLKTPGITVVQKINLKQRLLEIKRKQISSC